MKKYVALLLALTMSFTLLAGCGAASTDTDTTEASAEEPVSAVTCCNGSVTLHFTREGETWYWADDPDFSMDDQMLLSALDALEELEGIPISEDALPDYGLSSPEQYLTVTAGEQTTTYYIGSAQDDGSVYLNAQDNVTTVYLVPEAISALLHCSIYDLAQLPQLPELTEETIQAVEIVQGDTDICLTLSDGVWRYGDTDVTAEAAALSEALSQLAFSKCVDYAPAAGAAAICGLTDPAAVLTVTYRSRVGTTQQLVLTIGGIYGEGRFALWNDDTTIYQLSDGLASPILAIAESGI